LDTLRLNRFRSLVLLPLPFLDLKPAWLLNAANTSNARWAAVTGASSGIGAGICECLAVRGWNVVLIGRDESKLNELAAKLEKSNVKTLSISADLSTPEGVSHRLYFA